LLTVEKLAQGNFVPSQEDKTEVELKQLWCGKVPPLTLEQIDVALQLWQKIKTRKKQEKG